MSFRILGYDWHCSDIRENSMNLLYIRCLCGYSKLLVKKYQELGYEIRDVNNSIQYRNEAKIYGLKLPFKVVDGEATKI